MARTETKKISERSIPTMLPGTNTCWLPGGLLYLSSRHRVWPRCLDSLRPNLRLKIRQQFPIVPNRLRQRLPPHRLRRKRSRRLADVPLHRMQPITTVSNMRCSDVLRRGEHVLHSPGNQRAQRYLERFRSNIDIIVSATRRMQIDAVAPHSRRVSKMIAKLLLDDGELSQNPPRFANVGILRQSIFGPDDVRTQPQTGPPLPAIRPGNLSLQPVKQRQAELLRSMDMMRRLVATHFANISQPVVVLRPIHQRDVAGVSPRNVIPPV